MSSSNLASPQKLPKLEVFSSFQVASYNRSSLYPSYSTYSILTVTFIYV